MSSNFLTLEYQLINTKGMKGIENHLGHHSSNYSRQDPPNDAKING